MIAFPLVAVEFKHQIYHQKFPDSSHLDQRKAFSTLSQSIEKSFNFVSNEIDYELYPGALRGIEGTYLSRSGNSIDQSLLLAYLLKQQGATVRLVTANLSSNHHLTLEKLFENTLIDRPDKILPPEGAIEDVLSSTTANEIKQPLSELLAVKQEIYQRIQNILDKNRAILVPEIETSSPGMMQKMSHRQSKLSKEEFHVWVQLLIDNQWLDLDPSLQLDQGNSISSPETTIEINRLPEKWFYQTTIQITSQFQQKSSQKEKVNLKITSDSASLSNRLLMLTHPAKGGPMGNLISFDGFLNSKMGGIPYRPHLVIDEESYLGDPLQINGWAAESVFSFGQVGPQPELVAEFFKIEITDMNGRAQQMERIIFDRAGASERKKNGMWTLRQQVGFSQITDDDGNTTNQTDFSYAPQPLQSVYALNMRTGTLLMDEFPLLLSKNPLSNITNEADGFIKQIKLLMEFQRFQEWVRSTIFEHQFSSTILTPNLTALTVGVNEQNRENAYNNPVFTSLGFDYWLNEWHYPKNYDALSAGLLDAALEQVFMETLYKNVPEIRSKILSAFIIFEQASRDNTSLLYLSENAASQLSSLPKDIQELIKPLLKSYDIIIPETVKNGVSKHIFAWYLIDRESGEFKDMTQMLGSNALTEYIIKIENALEKSQMLCMMRQCLRGSLAVATNVLDVVRGRVSFKSADKLKKKIKSVEKAFEDAKQCSGVILHVKVYKKWKPGRNDNSKKYKDIQEKMDGLKSSARNGELVTPTKKRYKKLRKKKPGEFKKDREKDLNRKRKDSEDWDHRNELACGGKHSPKNIYPLDSSYNSSMGSVLGRSCGKLCPGTTIKDIVFEYVLDSLPGVGWIPLETDQELIVWINPAGEENHFYSLEME